MSRELTCPTDQIIVLREGEVAESGTHNELIAEGGVYSELWNSES